MKIGVLGFFQLRTMQYLTKYTDILDELNIDYDVIHWSRSNDDIAPSFKGRHIVFNYEMVTEQPFYKKIGGFLKYAYFMRKSIKTNNYDKLIILTTQTAIPLSDLLLGKYRKKYIYGFYDLTKENKSLFYKLLVKKILESARIVTISSFGFLPTLGLKCSDFIIQAHNTQKISRMNAFKAKLSDKEPIRISYWGIIRQLQYNKQLCDLFGNDKRFLLTYHGNGMYKELQLYCEKKNYDNIFFTGQYERKDIPRFIAETDIISCLYENDRETKPTLAVKLYDAVKYKMPILLNYDSYVSDFAKSLPGAFAKKLDEKYPNMVYDWYKKLNRHHIEEAYERISERIYHDDLLFRKELEKFITEK